jgi:predicted transcriptional regulator of viral defense system
MDALVRDLAARQADIVAAWQLLAAGWTRAMIDHHVKDHRWRVVHAGVYALTQAPLSRRQRWFAASLTSPDSFLSHASAGACHGFRPWEGSFEIVTRPGTGGPRRFGDVLVCRSTTLDGETTRLDGIAITTAARTLVDLSTHLDGRAVGRMFREALRLKTVTAQQVREALERCQGRRRNKLLADLASRYATLPYHRTKSNPEALALEILHDAGREPPRVNVKVAGKEADLTWPKHGRIIEIDGPDFHRFRAEDARKEAAWRRAGYTVRRIPSDDIYHRPEELLRLAP